MRRYEALVILHNPPKEEAVKEAIDRISAEVNAGSGTVETVQKMDRKPFSRVSSKKVTSGYYVNIIFQLPPLNLAAVRARMSGLSEVYRVSVTAASASKPAQAVA